MKFIKKLVALALVAASLFAIAIPVMAATTTKYVKVSDGPGHTVNIRASASTGSRVLATATYGSAIYVNSTSNGWSSVTYYDPVKRQEYNGYISSEYLVNSIPSDTYWIQLYGTRDHKLTNSWYEGCEELQIDLNNNLGLSLSEDGYCGAKTVEAIKQFQRANNLSADGVAGNRTKEYLYKLVH